MKNSEANLFTDAKTGEAGFSRRRVHFFTAFPAEPPPRSEILLLTPWSDLQACIRVTGFQTAIVSLTP